MTKQCWPAPERNKQPILEVLQRVLPERGVLLEVSSGSGQHAAFFARALPSWTILPTDLDAENLSSIQAWVDDEKLPNLRTPVRLDVTQDKWLVPQVDAIFNANMIHIAPWECCVGLMRGAARHLKDGGTLVLYGPYKIGFVHTSASNEEFDAGLRARDARWGVRDLERVVEEAEKVGLKLSERVQMPANNQILVFGRLG